MVEVAKCALCGKDPNKWVSDEFQEFQLHWGHCGITCEGLEKWNRVQAAMDAERRLAEVEVRAYEKCAEIAWLHFMGTCKKKGLAPANCGEWLAATAIRDALAKLEEK